LIPGIPIQTRISILQQTDADEAADAAKGIEKLSITPGSGMSVLEQVIDRATSRNEIQSEIDGMSHVTGNSRLPLTSHSSLYSD
jgi:hypothetical protein